ncbi:MAG: glutathione binding-like protein [Immundisolibacterales bacterium]|nr:glutathione binding-like protein [Immundisolibacterales bacterium]
MEPDDFVPRLGRGAVMSLYSADAEPVSHAIRVVLAEKAVNVEIRFVSNQDERPEDLHALNPYDSILTLVDRDLVLYEPQIIMEYLDERFPHPPLMPVDPVTRANSRLYRYRIQRDIYGLVDLIEGDVAGGAEEARRQLRDHLTALTPVFEQTRFFMADEYSLVDCYLAPILWRLLAYGIRLPPRSRGLRAYADRVFEREAFERSLTDIEREMR